jgi:hypothetical protein
MATIKEYLLSGLRPSIAIREVAKSRGELSSKELIMLLDEELNGIPPTVANAIANWNRKSGSMQKCAGLNDLQFDDAVWGDLNAAIARL